MAYYKNGAFLQQQNGQEYDALYTPGERPPYSGIYRCNACGVDVSCNKGNPLPPQNHHQHPGAAPIRWHLIVKSTHLP